MEIGKTLRNKMIVDDLNKKYATYILAGKDKNLYIRFKEDEEGDLLYLEARSNKLLKYFEVELKGIIGTAKDIEELVIILGKE